MCKPVIKITLTGEHQYLDIFESEPGKLVFDMYSKDPEDPYGGGTITTESDSFFEAIKKLLNK
ncbi:hypothetical protein DXT63_08560 [Thermoanaerobacteraceae bacterium SP2]|nr:hypothetical protein DXT63_08560 [Thermoanaerobacteraceae bacterium SP2]